jgi:DNA polymerase-1
MVIVFDGNPFIYKGQNTFPDSKIAGACNLLSSLIEAHRTIAPEKVIVLFDPPTRYWRHAVYPDYKGHRKQNDRTRLNVREQINLMKSVCEHLPVSVLCCPGYEADDAAYWLKGILTEDVIFITIDRDWLQLVGAYSSVYLFDINEKITNKNFKKFECPSKPKGYDQNQFLLYKIANGDTSDNIKGIPGFGPVRCKELIDNFDKKRYITLTKDVFKRNSLLMDLSQTPFLPFAHRLYLEQLRKIGEFNIRALKPLLIGELWGLSGEFDVFERLQ